MNDTGEEERMLAPGWGGSSEMTASSETGPWGDHSDSLIESGGSNRHHAGYYMDASVAVIGSA